MTRISCLENLVCLHKSSSATVGCLKTLVVPMSKYPSSMGESGGVAISLGKNKTNALASINKKFSK